MEGPRKEGTTVRGADGRLIPPGRVPEAPALGDELSARLRARLEAIGNIAEIRKLRDRFTEIDESFAFARDTSTDELIGEIVDVFGVSAFRDKVWAILTNWPEGEK